MEKEQIIKDIIAQNDAIMKSKNISPNEEKFPLYELKRFLEACDKDYLERIYNNGSPDIDHSFETPSGKINGLYIYAHSNRENECFVLCLLENFIEGRILRNNRIASCQLSASAQGIRHLDYANILFNAREAIAQILS